MADVRADDTQEVDVTQKAPLDPAIYGLTPELLAYLAKSGAEAVALAELVTPGKSTVLREVKNAVRSGEEPAALVLKSAANASYQKRATAITTAGQSIAKGIRLIEGLTTELAIASHPVEQLARIAAVRVSVLEEIEALRAVAIGGVNTYGKNLRSYRDLWITWAEGALADEIAEAERVKETLEQELADSLGITTSKSA